MARRVAIVTNMKDRDFQARHLSKAIRLCIEAKLFAPALVLIAAGIDAFSGGTKKAFNRSFRLRFPELSKELGATSFYSKYRNGILHEFSAKKGFGIAEDYELEGQWLGTFYEESAKKEITCINIEKLADVFLSWVDSFSKKKQN